MKSLFLLIGFAAANMNSTTLVPSYVPCEFGKEANNNPQCSHVSYGGVWEEPGYGYCVKLTETPLTKESANTTLDGACACLWFAALTNADDPACDYTINEKAYYSPVS